MVSALLVDNRLKVIPTTLLFKLKQSGWSRQEIAIRAKTKNQSVRLIMRKYGSKDKTSIESTQSKNDKSGLLSVVLLPGMLDFRIRALRANFAAEIALKV
jgi:hypothetical protein